MYNFLLHYTRLLNIDSCISLLKKYLNKTLKQIEIKVAKLIRVYNATTMIDVVRLVIVPELLLKR